MASTKHAISEHDVVVLREAVGDWPAGTQGAVVSVYEDALLVEIVGGDGTSLDVFLVPAERLSISAA